MVVIFSQNFTSNGPYVVLNFCEFSDRGSPPLTQFSNNTVLGQIFVKFGEFLSILSIKSKYVVIWAISFQKKTGWSLIYQLLLGPYFLKVYYYTQYPIIRNADQRWALEFLKNYQFLDADRFLIFQVWALAVS